MCYLLAWLGRIVKSTGSHTRSAIANCQIDDRELPTRRSHPESAVVAQRSWQEVCYTRLADSFCRTWYSIHTHTHTQVSLTHTLTSLSHTQVSLTHTHTCTHTDKSPLHTLAHTHTTHTHTRTRTRTSLPHTHKHTTQHRTHTHTCAFTYPLTHTLYLSSRHLQIQTLADIHTQPLPHLHTYICIPTLTRSLHACTQTRPRN